MENNKLTEVEIEKLKLVYNKIYLIQIKLGQMSIEEYKLNERLQQIENNRNNTIKELNQVSIEQNIVLKELNTKYGDINVNIQDWTYNKNAQ